MRTVNSGILEIDICDNVCFLLCFIKSLFVLFGINIDVRTLKRNIMMVFCIVSLVLELKINEGWRRQP